MSNVGIPSWAVRGAKVVCIRDWTELRSVVEDPWGVLQYPGNSDVFTIREVRVRYVPEYGEALVGILLDELQNPPSGGGSGAGEEMAFDVRGFRPLVSRAAEQDVAIFAPLLDQVPEVV